MDDTKKDKDRLGRRSLVMKVAAGTAAAATVTAGVPREAEAQSGLTDNDPSDRPGFGGRPYTGITDRDPSDGAGRGRGGSRGSGGRPYTGINDGDPRDPSGYGTGWRLRGGGGGGYTD